MTARRRLGPWRGLGVVLAAALPGSDSLPWTERLALRQLRRERV